MSRFQFVMVALLGAAAGCGPSEDSSPPGSSGPTWYKDVEPIVQTKCAGCHYEGGIGAFAMGADNAPALSPLMSQKVSDRTMPPWPPGPLSQPIRNARTLTDEQIDTIVRWAKNGAALGNAADHQDRPPEITFDPGRSADFDVLMSGQNIYVPPMGSGATDEVRCFVLDLPPGTPNLWVTALQWVAGQPAGIHHIGGLAVDAQSASIAKGFYNADGRPGYECAGGFGQGVTGVAGFGASGAGKDTGTLLPEGTGIFVPAGSSIILSVHYIIANITTDDAGSGVQLWTADSAQSKGLRPMVQYSFNAPSELPCPSGVTTDPNDRCSREHGLAQVNGSTPEKSRAINDYLLKSCNTTLNEHYAKLDFNSADPSHFHIPTSCVVPSPHEGIIHIVHAHMHTRGASARIEVKQQDGTWLPLLDIPRWDWTWEAAYLLEQGAVAPAGRELRVNCEYDNGTANQWSLTTNEPGHGGPALPPLQEPRYVVAGSTRDSDMCGAFLTLEKPPYKKGTYADICHEVQAIYDDVCATSQIDFLAAPCQGDLERSAVLLVQATEAVFRNYACAPQGPAANVGATCEAVNNCALACGATMGLNNGIPPACLTACKTNANSYGPTSGQPPQAGSPAGSFRFDNLMQCSQPACSAEKTWQGYLDCLTYACTDLAKFCYAP